VSPCFFIDQQKKLTLKTVQLKTPPFSYEPAHTFNTIISNTREMLMSEDIAILKRPRPLLYPSRV